MALSRDRLIGTSRAVLDALSGSYSQIFFTESRVVGALLLASTLVVPQIFLGGLLATTVALGTAWVLKLPAELIRSGLFGYNALLVGLGGAALLPPGREALLLIVVAVVAAVLLTAAFHAALGVTFGVPALTLPFLAAFYVVLGARAQLGIDLQPLPHDPWIGAMTLPEPVTGYLQSLGAIFFLPRIDAGLVVLVALVVFSRIGWVLSVLGFALAYLLVDALAVLPGGVLPWVVGYNFMLVSVAIGGVWFVASPAAMLLATAAVLVCAMLTVGLLPYLALGGMPLLILPFNLTVMLVLYAMRQRVRDGAPKSVDFLPGTPEQNLHHYQMRIARFGANYAVRLHAPFLGTWVCAQGVDGALTHRGMWRHAFDFEVRDGEERAFRNQGRTVQDYLCYRLPVLAPADATVVKVVDGVPDNPIGEVNLRDNWGNAVVLYVGPNLYALLCHLAPGSIKVREGQIVRQGEQLALCGSSGRSPTPHLHFQLQATARLGAPTLAIELHDVVSEQAGKSELRATYVPREGDRLRNIEPQGEVAALFRFAYGEPMAFRVSRHGVIRRETLTPTIDLFGNMLMGSQERRAVLYYEIRSRLMTVYDAVGSSRSALRLLYATLARVPFEVTQDFTWHDAIPVRHLVRWPMRRLLDLVGPFYMPAGLVMCYRSAWEGGALVVRGESVRHRHGAPFLMTEARVRAGVGIERLVVRAGSREYLAERIEEGQS